MNVKQDVVDLAIEIESRLEKGGAEGKGLAELWDSYKQRWPHLGDDIDVRSLETQLRYFRTQRNKIAHGVTDRATKSKVVFNPSPAVVKRTIEAGLLVVDCLDAVEAAKARQKSSVPAASPRSGIREAGRESIAPATSAGKCTPVASSDQVSGDILESVKIQYEEMARRVESAVGTDAVSRRLRETYGLDDGLGDIGKRMRRERRKDYVRAFAKGTLDVVRKAAWFVVEVNLRAK